MNTQPLEFQWVAVTTDGETISQASGTAEEKTASDLDLSAIKRFAFRNQFGQDIYGIDVEPRVFMIMGVPFFVDLPVDTYRVFFKFRNRYYSDGGFTRTYILGLQGKQERYLYINPDRSFTFTQRFI